MFAHRKFDVEVTRSIDASLLGWPERGMAAEETGLGGNRDYTDMRRLSWAEARRALLFERQLIDRLEAAEDWDLEFSRTSDELFESGDLYGLDPGVSAVVLSLSAAGCVPFASCNAGAFGGHHHEAFPIVAFYARPEKTPLLLSAAEEAEIGLEGVGCLIVYADDIRKMLRFAQALVDRSSAFRAIRRSLTHSDNETAAIPSDDRQMILVSCL